MKFLLLAALVLAGCATHPDGSVTLGAVLAEVHCYLGILLNPHAVPIPAAAPNMVLNGLLLDAMLS